MAAALTLPHTGQAIAIDVGDAGSIHPRKQDVGDRLARVARKVVYDEAIVRQVRHQLARRRGDT